MNPQELQIQIDIDDATARGIYTNLALITHSETEMILDFVFLQPQNPKAKVMARVVTSPVHAKRLMMALKENLEKYEARFGSIRVEPTESPAKPVGFYQ
jgi:hypothetical protein